MRTQLTEYIEVSSVRKLRSDFSSAYIFKMKSRFSSSWKIRYTNDRHYFPVGFLAVSNLPPLTGSSWPCCRCQSAWHNSPPSKVGVFSSINCCHSSPAPFWCLRVPSWQNCSSDERPPWAVQSHCGVLAGSWALPPLIKMSWMSSARTWTTLSVSPLARRNQLHVTRDNHGT